MQARIGAEHFRREFGLEFDEIVAVENARETSSIT